MLGIVYDTLSQHPDIIAAMPDDRCASDQVGFRHLISRDASNDFISTFQAACAGLWGVTEIVDQFLHSRNIAQTCTQKSALGSRHEPAPGAVI